MHDVHNRGFRYTLAAAGMAASLIFLLASAFANFRYGSSLAKSSVDGWIYGSAAAACDVLMAASPFFFFAAKRNRAWTQMLAASSVWVVMTAVAAVSAISQTSVNRIDAISARITQSTSYADTRTELQDAKTRRALIPQTNLRPVAVVRAELERHKVNTLWTATSECTEVTGKSGRAYCGTYQSLTADLGYAMQAAKLDEQITALMAKSDKAAEANPSVAAEADAGAKSLSVLSGYGVRSVQSGIVALIALMFLVGAGLGPYVSWSVMDTHQLPASVTHPIGRAGSETADVSFSLPALEPPPAGPKMLAAPISRPEPPPEGKVVLARIGFPKMRPEGDARAMSDAERETIGLRLLCWATAHGIRGDFAQDVLWQIMLEHFETAGLVPCAERIAKAALADVHKGRKYYATKTVTSPVVWSIRLPDFEELHGLLDKAGFPAAPKAGRTKLSPTKQDEPPAEEAAPAKGDDSKIVRPFGDAAAPAPRKPIKGLSELQRMLPNIEAMRAMGRKQKATFQQRFAVRDRKQANKHRRSRAA